MRVIGLISGTSVDGIDVAMVDISGNEQHLGFELIAAQTYPYPVDLQAEIMAVAGGAAMTMLELAELDDRIAETFAIAALTLEASVTRREPGNEGKAELLGSHGQTIYHLPPRKTAASQPGTSSQLGYSIQLGRGEAIAHQTGITTVSNFRKADLAAGGQGAPLVPRVDAYLLGNPTVSRCIQNIGGIGNLTYLPAGPVGQLEKVCGWDTGPGNMLLDLAVQQLTGGALTYDRDGAWAARGTPCSALVNQWLKYSFFQQAPPKSTGREEFGSDFLQRCLTDAKEHDLIKEEDLLATLTELTAASIVQNYREYLPQMPEEVLLCGGGSRNLYLRQRLQKQLGTIPVLTTDEVGLNAEYKEAIAFAVLAYWRYHGIAGNVPRVTGAMREMLLGEIHIGGCCGSR
ncbi:MAG: anhydro-N-acetylmuramic acid kinase [Hormoscilla sp. GM102CHS1]|nr:anhydro-N-acetylmuramic acid kinase [Hormoscilla sp. GM102CHS1]